MWKERARKRVYGWSRKRMRERRVKRETREEGGIGRERE